MPDEGGHYLLVQVLGLAGALDFMLRARLVDARRPASSAWSPRAPRPDEVVAAAVAQAAELAAGPQLALRMLKRAIYRAAESDFDGRPRRHRHPHRDHRPPPRRRRGRPGVP